MTPRYFWIYQGHGIGGDLVSEVKPPPSMIGGFVHVIEKSVHDELEKSLRNDIAMVGKDEKV